MFIFTLHCFLKKEITVGSSGDKTCYCLFSGLEYGEKAPQCSHQRSTYGSYLHKKLAKTIKMLICKDAVEIKPKCGVPNIVSFFLVQHVSNRCGSFVLQDNLIRLSAQIRNTER